MYLLCLLEGSVSPRPVSGFWQDYDSGGTDPAAEPGLDNEADRATNRWRGIRST